MITENALEKLALTWFQDAGREHHCVLNPVPLYLIKTRHS